MAAYARRHPRAARVRLEDSAQEIADVVMDAMARADEAVLDLEVLAVVFTIVVKGLDGSTRTITATWADIDG